MKTFFCIFAVVMLGFVGSVQAKEEYEPIGPVEELFEKCLSFVEDDYEKYNKADEQFCSGFFQGFKSGMVAQESAKSDGICVPGGVWAEDLAKIYTEYTKKHLDYLAKREVDLGYWVFITKSLQEKFPCKKETSFKSLLAKAEKGDAEAQYRVGLKYHWGTEDVLEDVSKAAKWYEKAAKQGHPMAQNSLGGMYFVGIERGNERIEKDINKAMFWLNKAMEHEATATLVLNNLATFYFTGTGVPKDVDKAIEYYTKSAELGDEMAAFTLGRIYYEGLDVPKDKAKGKYWLTKAAEKKPEVVKDYLEKIEKEAK